LDNGEIKCGDIAAGTVGAIAGSGLTITIDF
jgi:hypothetical protein